MTGTLSDARPAPVGLLAGSGRFPIVFAEKARELGIPVVCVGLRHEASPELEGLVSRFYWCGVARLGRMIQCFRREHVCHVVMAGKVQKTATGSPRAQAGDFLMWNGSWELFDLPPGTYTLELTALDKQGKVVTSRSEKLLHGNPLLKQ